MLSVLSLLLLAPAPVAASDAVVGRWKTETRGGVVEIQRCGRSVCGRLLTSELLRTNPDLRDGKNKDAALRTRPLRNLQILSDFTWSDGTWDGGKIYNADDGRTYSAKITIAGPNSLKLRGCVFVPLCKTQTWTRVR